VGPGGLIKYAGVNQPRFDHDPITGESLGLLIEESRTNMLAYSIPSSGTWTKANTDITSNSIISPDGTQNASLVKGSTAVGFEQRYINLNSSIISGQTYTQTFFVKAGTTNYIQIAPSTGFGINYVNFELIGNGRIGNSTVSSAFIQAFPNGWYRIGVTETATSTVSGRMLLCAGSSPTNGRLPNTPPYSFYVWGAQLEVGAFPTSYIPTVSSTRTRNSDRVSITGTKFSSWYNQSEGTTYWNASCMYNIPSVQFPGVWDVNDTTSANVIALSFLTNTISSFNVYSNNKQVALIYPPTKVTPLLNRKSSGAYKIKDYATSLNGSLYKSNVSGPVPIVTQLNIGGNQFGNTSNILNGTISRLTYYPKRLPNNQLQALTR
jgi:hypothetical protein